LLALATYRDGEVSGSLAQTLSELARAGVPRIGLNGLTPGRHRAFARQTDRSTLCDTPRPTDPRADRWQPVFCDRDGQKRHPRSAGHSRNVRMAISQRLRHLSALANRTLVVAAVVDG
jgi:hypothetical protein